MPYLDKENNPVIPEKWQWIAVYKDGTGIRQFDYENQAYHYFAEIEQAEVSRFGLICPDTGKIIIKDIPEGAKLIHYYDNIMQHPIGGTAVHHRLFCFGYELGKEKVIWTMLPSDVVIRGDLEDIEVM